MWVNAEEVIAFTGAKPHTFRFEQKDKASLNTLIEGWIKQSESLIKSYCNNDFQSMEDNMPDAVVNVCLRLTANMVALAQARKETPLIKVNDWSIQTVGSEIFSQDLKDDLEPWVRERKSHKSDRVEFLCIHG
ncbi:MAG: hypothetical protein IJH65_10115 [Methanobrevibacter sp.]|nr:hypothetical protein [Methanobrevibacter sp.]